ncbi:MAG: hypothetical protein AB8H80_00045 [Planctomycetota bacterium]
MSSDGAALRAAGALVALMAVAGLAAWSLGVFAAAAPPPDGTSAHEQTVRNKAQDGSVPAAKADLRPSHEVAPSAASSDSAPATLLLPDGSEVPTLNGATGAKPLADVWPKQRPWSPIVGVERSTLGVDWYVHADGTRTTTQMRWRADLGRDDALTRIAEVAPDQPAVPRSK